MDKEEGSLADVLNVDKSQEEMEELAAQCMLMFNENPDTFLGMALMTLETHGLIHLLTLPIPGLNAALAETNKQFFTAGYIKGICHQEETAKLENMMRKE